MLGLHNIFLIAPPPSSFNQPISSSHQIPNFNDHCNILNNQYSWTTLKKYQQEPGFAKKDAPIIGEDNENSSSSSRVCRDCGNRAKKECEFRRCRTCCKGRGFDCATHVKSTWVPASRRKERHSADGGGGGTSGSSSAGAGGNKRPRETVTTTSNSFSTSYNNAAAPTAFNFDTGSNYQDASFKQSLPSQVRAPAVFRCIRVTAINGGEAEVAYQAMVNISGHVFKGFLYDQGIDEKNMFPCISKMPSNGRNRDSTSPIVDPPNGYHAASASQRLLEGNE